MKLVYANQNVRLTDKDELPYTIREDSIWDADHPLVKRHAWAFSDAPRRVNGEQYHPVEAATAAPGERRGRVG